MTNARAQYEAIVAPPTLRVRVNHTFDTRRKEQRLRNVLAVAAAFTLTVATLNMFPAIAYATQDIPVLGALVRVLTFNRFVIQENGYGADIATPYLEGLLDIELQDELNARFKGNADALIAEFERDTKVLKEMFGEEIVHFGFVSGYDTRTENDRILAVELYTYSTAGTMSLHSFITIDKESGKPLYLQNLFKEGADYRVILSSYLIGEMQRLNKERGYSIYFLEGESPSSGFSLIKEDQQFYINKENQLVLCFDKHEVAVGALGAPEFIIPFEIIKDIVIGDILR